MGAQTLPGGMAIDKCLNLADDLGVAAGLEVRIDSFLDHRSRCSFSRAISDCANGSNSKSASGAPRQRSSASRIMVARCTGSVSRGQSTIR